MRVWLDPEKLKARNLTTQDVFAAIAEQNVQVAAGQVGQPRRRTHSNFQFIVSTLGPTQRRLSSSRTSSSRRATTAA